MILPQGKTLQSQMAKDIEAKRTKELGPLMWHSTNENRIFKITDTIQ